MHKIEFTFFSFLLVSIFLSGCKGKSDKPEVTFEKKAVIEKIAGFEILDGGDQVRDPATDLIWQRCGYGQTWKDAICVGALVSVNFSDTSKTAPQGWRMPTIRELSTLMDCSEGKYEAEIDIQDGLPAVKHSCRATNAKTVAAVHPAFDSNPKPTAGEPMSFWASNRMADNSNYAWIVYFYGGQVNGSPVEEKHYVRFVRKS
jgi:uncharacterized protein (TIGR02145 family)